MAELKHWYLICYDIREQKRWRKAYKLLQGYGETLQSLALRSAHEGAALPLRHPLVLHALTETDLLAKIKIKHTRNNTENEKKKKEREATNTRYPVVIIYLAPGTRYAS